MARFEPARWFSVSVALATFVGLTAATPPELSTREQILAAHNAERAGAGVVPLRWNDDLARGAQQWSEHLAETGRFEHSPDLPGQPEIGENIWGGTPGRFSPKSMVSAWIAEKRYFRPGKFPTNSATGRVQDVTHYTQVVWRRTTEVGCAIARGNSEEILVCRYSAPGNIIGQSPV
jgi:hypothetical protein